MPKIYYQAGALFAAPFDLDRKELTGLAVQLVQSVKYTTGVANADFDVSPGGTLVYIRGAGSGGRVVSWLDASAKTAPLLVKPAEYLYSRLSPDGKRLAIVISENGADSLSVYDQARDGSGTQILSGPGVVGYPVWTPDGEFIENLSMVHFKQGQSPRFFRFHGDSNRARGTNSREDAVEPG